MTQEYVIIQGLTVDGQTFRPSDWAERLAGTMSTVGKDGKLVYSQYVAPILWNGTRCVWISGQLKKHDPEAYNFLISFGNDNNLQVLEIQQLSVR